MSKRILITPRRKHTYAWTSCANCHKLQGICASCQKIPAQVRAYEAMLGRVTNSRRFYRRGKG